MTRPSKLGYRYFDLIMALFVAVLLISNIASSKILKLGPFTFDGGTLLFPISYIFGDILTEVYGYRRSRRVIWVGFACAGLMAGVLALVGALPPAEGWEHQDAYEAILGTTPRIVLGSLIAYFAGEFSNNIHPPCVLQGQRFQHASNQLPTCLGGSVSSLGQDLPQGKLHVCRGYKRFVIHV